MAAPLLPSPSEFLIAQNLALSGNIHPLETLKLRMAAYADGLVQESHQRLRMDYKDPWGRCQTNMELFLYGRAYNRMTGRFVVRKIQNACISNVATQTATPPKFLIRQRSTGEPPTWYLNASFLPPGMIPPTVQGDDPANAPGMNPLDPATVQQLQQLIQQAKMEAQATGQPPAIDPNVLVRVDDTMIREALQTALDTKLDTANALKYIRENFLYNTIFGFQFMALGWDDEERRPKYRNIEPVLCHVDLNRTSIDEMAFFIYDEFLGREEALQLYPSPEMQVAINKYAQTGRPMLAGAIPYLLPAYWQKQIFYREVVVIRHAYLRYHRFPLPPREALAAGKVANPAMTPEAALAAGHVVQREVPDENAVPQMAPDAGGVEQPAPAVPTRTALIHAQSGEEITPNDVAWPRDESQYVDPKTGQPMKLGDPAWPTRSGIWQWKIVAGKLIEAIECQRTNIPIMHNVNIGIPGSPLGQGEPERLESAQDAYNRTVSDIVVTGEYAANPASYTGNDIMKANPGLVAGAHSKPGKVWVVPESYIMGNIEPIKPLMPPTTPPDQWQREAMLGKIFENSSNESAVRNGTSPTPNASGVLAQTLVAQGDLSVNYKGQTAETALAYMGGVTIGDILLRMTPEQLAEDFPKFSVFIWREAHRRLLKHYLFCGLSVEVAGGAATTRQNRAIMLTNAKVQGVPVSDPEILETMDLDPDEQVQKQGEFDRMRAMEMPQQVGPDGEPLEPGEQPGQPPQPGKKKGPPNGSTQ